MNQKDLASQSGPLELWRPPREAASLHEGQAEPAKRVNPSREQGEGEELHLLSLPKIIYPVRCPTDQARGLSEVSSPKLDDFFPQAMGQTYPIIHHSNIRVSRFKKIRKHYFPGIEIWIPNTMI